MPALAYIPEILEEHFEELAFLLHLRAAQISSGRMLFRQFIDLDDRLEGHIQGLLAVPDATVALALPLLGEKDPLMIRGAALILAALDHAAGLEKCFAALANPALAAAVLEGLLLRRAPGTQNSLKQLAQNSGAAAQMAVMAMTLQAEHFSRDLNQNEFGKFLSHADAPIRAAAWRAAARLGDPRTPMQYRAGCVDAIPEVRDAALTAAAWAGQPLLDVLRPFLKKPDPANLVPLQLFAILAPAAEAPAVCALAQAAALGAARFDLLASAGFPAVVPPLLAAMRDADAAVAAPAAAAFERLTRFQPPSKGAKTVVPKGADAFEKEFLGEVNIPDADAAQRHWSTVEGSLGKSPRIARGIAVEPAPADEELLELDCAARDAVLLRRAAGPEGKKHAAWNTRWGLPQCAAR